jgi:hypothetical protein
LTSFLLRWFPRKRPPPLELYDSRRLPGPPPDDNGRPVPPHLPGIGQMTPYEKACALAAYVGADLARLEAALGLGMPTAKSIKAVLDTPGHARDEGHRAVHDLYFDIRNRLAGTDPAAALAFGLGLSWAGVRATLGRAVRPSTPCGTPRWSRPSGRRPPLSRTTACRG